MREISYTCDKCGKPIQPRFATKLSIHIQKGANPVQKKPYDFCSTCFLSVKSVFLNSLKMEEEEEDTGLSDTAPKEELKVSEPKRPDTREAKARDNGTILGPLSDGERAEILRLFVEEGLDADRIAARMNRLPRGVKRTINKAEKSGELEKCRAAFAGKKQAEGRFKHKEVIEEEDILRGESGSGATNAGVRMDAYVTPPKTEVIGNKRYDVGGILALANAGWDSSKIAEERHYDEDVVRSIVERYYQNKADLL